MTLQEVILECLGKVKANNVIVYDMRGHSPFYDEMILCSVDVERQASAVISYIEEETSKHGFKIRNVEGLNTSWVLIDCYDVIVSIFTKEEREHFALEKLYLEIPSTKVKI